MPKILKQSEKNYKSLRMKKIIKEMSELKERFFINEKMTYCEVLDAIIRAHELTEEVYKLNKK